VARGWESKSVESRQHAAADARPRGRPLTPAEAVRQADRATLLLAGTRTLADLQTAPEPAHRAMLGQALAESDRRPATLDPDTHEPRTP
jgi:hypothetical protein